MDRAVCSWFGQWKWKAKQTHPQKWERFWSRANALLGYDHAKLLGSLDPNLIGDYGLSVLEWVRLLKNAELDSIEVLLRDADEVIVASSKPRGERIFSSRSFVLHFRRR
jgi:hypothetical protein